MQEREDKTVEEYVRYKEGEESAGGIRTSEEKALEVVRYACLFPPT